MTKHIEALKLALEALEEGNKLCLAIGGETSAVFDPAITAIRETLAEQPAPPPECKTDAEKTAFAFGWWKALEENRKQPAQQLEEYDAGLLNDFGGGNVEWWQDYIRAELGRAYEHYQSQIAAQPDHIVDANKMVEQPAKQQAGHTFYDGNGNVVAHLDATAEITMDYSKPSAWAQRKPWVGLTDEDIEDIFNESAGYGRDDFRAFARAIEAKLKERNA